MAEDGVPLPIMQSMVGHMSAAVTRRYTHISNTAARRAVERLDEPRRRTICPESPQIKSRTMMRLVARLVAVFVAVSLKRGCSDS